MASFVQTVSSVWRAHTALDDSDSAESSPEVPEHSRKLRPSSSFGSLRASLRQRLPLRPVQARAGGPPVEESAPGPRQCLRRLTRSACSAIGGAYQTLQKNCGSQEEYLVQSPCQIIEGEENVSPVQVHAQAARIPAKCVAVTPKRSVQRTPRSGGRRSPGDLGIAAHSGSSRRQLVRMAALRSPFASPNTLSRQREFDRDLESLSSGLNKLKRLSRVFDDVIGRDDRAQALENYRRVMMRSYGAAQSGPSCRVSRTAIKHKTQRMREVVSSWTHAASSQTCKAN